MNKLTSFEKVAKLLYGKFSLGACHQFISINTVKWTNKKEFYLPGSVIIFFGSKAQNSWWTSHLLHDSDSQADVF